MVEELDTLLVEARVEKPNVLVGHSFSGALVRLDAHDYSDQVTGIDGIRQIVDMARDVPCYSELW